MEKDKKDIEPTLEVEDCTERAKRINNFCWEDHKIRIDFFMWAQAEGKLMIKDVPLFSLLLTTIFAP